MRKGSRWLKATLFSCAWAAVRTKGSYFRAQFHRLKARRDAKKAIGAVAASLLRTIYHMLKDGTLYQDLGADPFDRREKTSSTASFGGSRTSGSLSSSPRRQHDTLLVSL